MEDIKSKKWIGLLKETIHNVWCQLGSSLTENFYTRAIAAELKDFDCVCHTEDPIPVPFISGKTNRVQYIGTCYADINVLTPDTIRILIEIKHSQPHETNIKQAKQQILKYNQLLGLNMRERASHLVVIFFPKQNKDSPMIIVYDHDGTKLEKLHF
jgi:hypothetical protein